MKFVKITVAAALLSTFALAMAGEIKPFNQGDFDALSAAGKSVVLDISAPWCPTCVVQKPIIEKLMKQPDFHDVTLLTLDFDKSKPALKKFRVSQQSTLVAFKGGIEVGRSVGDTTPDGLDGLIRKTVN